MDDTDLCYMSIAALGQAFRARSISPAEATRAALDRIRALDGRLNAFITVLQDAALAQARQAEAELARGFDRGPLHGVPISLKDLIDTAGVRTTAGSRLWHERVPAASATLARRLADAGAVLLGKNNLLEFAYGIVHPDFGQCNNPWDVGRTSGGSSSGSAAAVAAGMGYGSIGTDTGGSIRIPASYCGVVGLKPTFGRVSLHGVCPLSWSLDHAGPLARSVEDCAILLQVIAGPDRLDRYCLAADVPDYRAGLGGDVRGLRVGVLAQHLGGDLRPGVAECFAAALRELEGAGMIVRQVEIPSLASADDALLAVVMPEASHIHRDWLRAEPGAYAEETRAQLQHGLTIPAVDYLRAQEYRDRLRDELLAVLREVDLLASPSVPWEAPAEDPPVDGGQGALEARRTGPYNLAGLPAISVPCGIGPAGLPLGLQLATAPLAEPLLLRVAHAYERRAGYIGARPAL